MVVLPKNRLQVSDLLDAPIVFFDQDPKTKADMDAWTFRHAFEGTQIFGATGSDKTTGSRRTLALAFLTSKLRGEEPLEDFSFAPNPKK